ncbi:MAG: 1-(5-phosphoribosyl)-5-[(5-phosphoribosylamino)methylideneamino]imidazole-4-carboxamide isomerase [Firmicutes bacterium HGW-Firmicutes-11]|jgi:phosphoribosylformimino-5-aminoimidazole carboxamide ribotide isomerase|nr:MAG: 1-(5-phosphoribosyl)-5-[(5-phosphoribosylamino)methylideneamino]imidazole-4-carboxamide isomerase [Firmicutes bacterium HGW-Firmicutes-11]
MIVYPAIDIKDGQCVRLLRGEFSTASKVAEDYLETAKNFLKQGATWIHMVDLDGAVEGVKKNSSIFLHVAEETKAKIQLGGGIRNMETVDHYLDHGISRVILGSAAIQDPEFVKKAIQTHGAKIAIGIDAMDGLAKAGGWLVGSKMSFIELAKAMESLGAKTIIYTDIARDGTLSGPNLKELEMINESVSCDIIASGGIRNIEDIQDVLQLGMHGVICGKSLYQGTLDLTEAIAVSGSDREV